MTGQLSSSESELMQGEPGLRNSDSPPNWIAANLEQLTNEPYSAGMANLGAGLSSLALDGRSSHLGTNPGLGGWGGNTANPPPGFGHRPSQLPRQYSGFALNKNTETQIGGKYY